MVTFDTLISRKDRIAVVGLGYVGLPLAVHLSKHFDVTGYDLKTERIRELESGIDRTLEVTETELVQANILFTDDPEKLSKCRLIIVAVPTPIDEYHIPDLTPLKGSSLTVGKHMTKGSCVVFESTVYPGATEEVCVPIMERESGLTFGRDFTVGYSPERINPGDKTHTIESITKIVSGSDKDTLTLLSQVYGKVVKAGLHPASSIKVAEAAKVIENTQRDLNIALMNELAMIFDKIGIDTTEVLEAAGTKWNFLPFRPGLVGGHCLSKDQLIFAKINGRFTTMCIESLYDAVKEDVNADACPVKSQFRKPAFVPHINSHDTLARDVCGEISCEQSVVPYLRLITSSDTNGVKFPRHTEILSYDLDSQKPVFKRVSLLTRRKYSHLIQFTTENHQVVKVSDDHPMIVSESGKFVVRLAKEITLSDKFVVNTRLPELDVPDGLDLIALFSESMPEDIQVRAISKPFGTDGDTMSLASYLRLEKSGDMPVSRNDILLVKGENHIQAVIDADENFARLTGYYLSRGHITRKQVQWCFQSSEKDYMEDVCACLNRLRCSYAVCSENNESHISVPFEFLAKLFKEVLNCGTNAYDAAIPDFLLYAPSNIRKNLMKGLFSRGFNVCDGEITYASDSKTLFHQVVLLLQDYGITPTFDETPLLLHIHGHENLSRLRHLFGKDTQVSFPGLSDHTNDDIKEYQKHQGYLTVGLKQIQKISDDYVYSLEVTDTETIISDYGLVLHNCIGVDPYYLTFKADSLGYHPEMILAGRRINDNMAKFVAERTVKMLIRAGKQVHGAKVAILGLTFKENVPDLRNTKIVDIITELEDYGIEVLVHDPLADADEAERYYNIKLFKDINQVAGADAVILGVLHNDYKDMGLSGIARLCADATPLIVDVKAAFSPAEAKQLNISYWRL